MQRSYVLWFAIKKCVGANFAGRPDLRESEGSFTFEADYIDVKSLTYP
jgi:hypothetical protein